MVVLYVLVSLCLVFSLTSLIIVTGNGSVPSDFWSTLTSAVKPEPTEETVIITPSPTSNTNYNGITYSYTVENYRIFTVNLHYSGEKEIKINYSQFYLHLSASRMIYTVYEGSASPQNNGTVTLGPTHRTEEIQLIFFFNPSYFNGMDIVPMQYELKLSS